MNHSSLELNAANPPSGETPASPSDGNANRQLAAKLLKQSYLKKKKEHRAFSLQRASREVGISVPFLSQILNGRRGVPIRKIEALCDVLDVDVEKREFIYRAFLTKRSQLERPGISATANPTAENSLDWTFQPAKQFWILEEPHYIPILNCTLLADYDGSPEFLARKLELSKSEAEQALTKLRNAGFLEMREGKLVKTTKSNDYNSKCDKEKIRRFHKNAMLKAQRELAEKTSEADLENRLITTFTMTASKKKIAWAKDRLNSVLKEISAELTSDPAEAVYQLGIQFFPVTRS